MPHSPRTRLAVRLAVLPLALGGAVGGLASSAARRAAAAQGSEEKAPIEVKAKPAVALAGTTVTLSGKTYVDGKRFTVTFAISPTSGPTVKLTAKADSEGRFSLAYKTPKAPGEYRVVVTAPDGKGTTTLSFKALGAAGLADAAGKSMALLAASAAEVTQGVHQGLAGGPDSPAKQQAEAKLDELEKKEGELAAKADAAAKAFARIAKLIADNPEAAPAFEPYAAELSEYEEQADDLRDHGTEYLKQMKREGLGCEALDFANEALGLLSMEMNLQGKIGKVLLNLATDKAIPALIDKHATKASDLEKFGMAEAQKAGAAAASSFKELAGSAFGLVADTAQFLSKKMFDKYCQKFEGPFTAKMDATFEGDAGQPYWKYTVTLKGKISLRYPKNATKGTVDMRGQIDGSATDFTFWEDVEKVEKFPKGGMVLLRKRITPVSGQHTGAGSDVGEALGRFSRAATPASFMIPITGKLTKNKLTVTMENAVWDFTDDGVKNRLVLVFANPALPIPIIKKFDFPILKARTILKGALKTDSPEFTVETDKASSHFDRGFTRRYEGPNKDIHITFTANLGASNPPAG